MKCFIISPIGKPGSESRKHADEVFECIIKPALKEAAVEGKRADHVKDLGRITRQMYDEILTSDFCIAVLHGSNPNVFYELAVAHSAGIPVILLSEKGVDLPFDLKDERVFQYDLSPIPIHRGDNARELLTFIDGVQRLHGKREVPFGSDLVPLNATGPDLPYFLRNESTFTSERLLQLVGQTRERLYLAGIGFVRWKSIPGMKEALRKAAESNCEIRVLTIDAQNPAFSAFMMNPDMIGAHSIESQGASFADARSWFKKTLGTAPKSDVRALQKGMLFQQIIVVDNKALISPFLFSTRTDNSPCLEINDGCPAFSVFLREFDELWTANSSN